MRYELLIAWRYLWQKKKHNAINIITAVSAVSMAVITAAMICVLSIMNGFGGLVKDLFSNFDPDLKIEAAEGKSFSLADADLQALNNLQGVSLISSVIEEKVLLRCGDKQVPAVAIGVENNFDRLTKIDSILIDGSFSLYSPITSLPQEDVLMSHCLVGVGLAGQLGVDCGLHSVVRLYAPKRKGRIDMLMPEKSFNEDVVFCSGIFAVNQVNYDDNYIIIPIDIARSIFDYENSQVTAVSLSLDDDVDVTSMQKKISSVVGEQFVVKNREEQQADYFKILKIEKLLTSALLIFILLIATFNLISSLSMLIIEKQDDKRTLQILGCSDKSIERIFLSEGVMITLLGALLGALCGVLLCVLQQHYGWLKLGSGEEYIISAYPVELQWVDVVFVIVSVIMLGTLSSLYTTRKQHRVND